MSEEQKESSVLFSLKELMNLEEDRIRQEDLERQRRAEAELRARQDSERRAREEQEARLAAEEERRRQEQQRGREEQARLEAIRAAEIERQRIEAERAAQLAAMSNQQEHDRQLERIRQDEGKKKLRNTVIGISVAAVLLLGGGLSLYFGKIKPEADAREAANQAALAEQQKAASDAQKRADEALAQIKDLNSKLSAANDEKTKAALQAQLDAATKNLNSARASGGGFRPAGDRPASGASPGSHGKCAPGDPLCVD